MFPACDIAVLLLVLLWCVYVLCTVAGSCSVGWLPPMSFWLPPKQVLKGKQWNNQSVKLSPNCLIAAGERPTQLEAVHCLQCYKF